MYIKVRVLADSKKEGVVEKRKDLLYISTKEPAEQNRANKRMIELAASFFSIPTNKIRIISGHHSPGKIISVDIEHEKKN